MRARVALGWMSIAILGGCYASHGHTGATDAGPSAFEGRWLIDQPAHALYEAVLYELERDGRLVELCRIEGGPPPDTVTRERDGLSCRFTGPWSSRVAGELAIVGYCDDSVQRTVVLDVEPLEVRVRKVGGEEGWGHGPFQWRWQSCRDAPDACASSCE